MRWLACALLLAVSMRHNSAFWVADMLQTTPAAVSYVMGGLLEVILGLAIASLLLTFAASVWRNLALVAAAIAVIEGSQMAVCRVLITDIRQLPPNTTLCDFVTGIPIGSVISTMYVLAVCFIVGREIGR